MAFLFRQQALPAFANDKAVPVPVKRGGEAWAGLSLRRDKARAWARDSIPCWRK